MESKEGKQAEQCAFVQLDFEHTRTSGEERSVQKEEYMHVGFQRGQAARSNVRELEAHARNFVLNAAKNRRSV